jgi:hypothetical protein
MRCPSLESFLYYPSGSPEGEPSFQVPFAELPKRERERERERDTPPSETLPTIYQSPRFIN